MSEIIIHVGAPRTGTSVLQKSLFPKLKNHISLQKEAYAPSIPPNDMSRQRLMAASPRRPLEEETLEARVLFLQAKVVLPSIKISREAPDPACMHILRHFIRKSIMPSKKTVLISSERLMENMATLHCQSVHKQQENCFFPAFSLAAAITSCGATPCITICLRSPIQHLRSKYLWNRIHRMKTKQRELSPKEFIQRQLTLESASPGTSVISYCMHSEVIRRLQKHGFVKAFGFQELIASDDVFSLMGLRGEDTHAFRNFPRENKMPFTKEREQAIEMEIAAALKQWGHYDRIVKAKMFE